MTAIRLQPLISLAVDESVDLSMTDPKEVHRTRVAASHHGKKLGRKFTVTRYAMGVTVKRVA